jgi:hypothetical protein
VRPSCRSRTRKASGKEADAGAATTEADTPEQHALDRCGGDINVAVASIWKAMSQEQRDVYQQRSAALKKRRASADDVPVAADCEAAWAGAEGAQSGALSGLDGVPSAHAPGGMQHAAEADAPAGPPPALEGAAADGAGERCGTAAVPLPLAAGAGDLDGAAGDDATLITLGCVVSLGQSVPVAGE